MNKSIICPLVKQINGNFTISSHVYMAGDIFRDFILMLKHFIRLFQYPSFGKLIVNTLRLNLMSLATFPLPIILALFLNEVKQVPFKKTVQMITYMPHFLTEVVVCSLVILFLDRTSGVINNMIAALGGERQSFMGMAEAFPHIYVLSEVWQGLGWGTILYSSALSSISADVIEAARIDGANEFRIFVQIVLPLSGAIIAVMTLYYAVAHWNSYFEAMIYITDQSLHPLQLVLRRILIMNESAYSDLLEGGTSAGALLDAAKRSYMATTMKYAMVFIASAPMLVLYPFIQKHFVKGIMVGSVKE